MTTNPNFLEAPLASPPKELKISPVRILVTLVCLIFLAEMFAMLVIYLVNPANFLISTLLDGLIMILLILPCLYYFQLNPLVKENNERARAEQAMRASEELLRKVLELLPVGVWITDAAGKIVHGNPTSEQIWAGKKYVGIDQYGEYKGWWLDSGEPIQPNDWAAARAIIKGETSINEEVEIECFDGTHKIILNSVVPIIDTQQAIQGCIIVNEDITERKRSERLFKTVLETLPVGVWITDETGKIFYGNPAGQQIWAGARYVGTDQFGEYKGWWLNTGKPIDAEEWAVARAIKNGEISLNEEIEIECFDGTHKIILNSAIPIRDERERILGAFVVNQDITRRKKAEQVLIQTNELLERYFNSIHTMIAYMDHDFNFIRVNDTYAAGAGHSPGFFIGKNHFDLYPHEENLAIFRKVVDTGEPYIVYEKVFENPEFPERGKTYWDWSLQPVKKADGSVEGVVLSLIDVSQRKRAELQLAQQNQELRQLTYSERQQRELAEGLVQVSLTLNASLNLDEVLQSILEQIRSRVPFQGGEIILLEGNTLNRANYLGFESHPESVQALERIQVIENSPLYQKIIADHQPIVIEWTTHHNGWRVSPGLEWVQSSVTVPMILELRVIGFINLYSSSPAEFTQETVRRLQAFAAPASLAVDNARLYKAESNARQIAEMLSASAHALTQTLNPEYKINTLLDHLRTIIASDTASVILLEDEENLSMKFNRGYGSWADREDIPTIALDGITDSLLQRIKMGRKHLIIPNLVPDSSADAAPMLLHIDKWLVIPLITGGKTIGLVELGNPAVDELSPELSRLVETLVSQAAVVIQNARLFEQLRASSERLQTLARSLVEIQESERYSIARELHDEAGQDQHF